MHGWINKDARFIVVRESAPKLDWRLIPGDHISATLSVSGDYVISHRKARQKGLFTVSYPPGGQHIHVAQCETLDQAKRAAEYHADLLAIPA